MLRYIARRLLQTIPVVLLASVAVFLMIYLIPGDPATVILGQNAMPAQVEALKAEMGLDKPLVVQYAIWLGRVARGDLGKSFINGFPVLKLITLRLPATLELTVAALILGVIIAFPVGVLSVMYRGSWLDRVLSAFMGLSYAIPTFWVGILLIIVFASMLSWLPPTGYASIVSEPAKGWKFLFMPALTLGIYASSVLARFLKISLLEVLGQDYMRTARAKGLKERNVLLGHALKNALIPVVTILGLQFGTLLGGAVVTEAVFDWPGVGQMLLNAIRVRDYTIVQGTILFVVLGFVVINLLTDLVYAFLDPRIRYD